MSDVEGRAITVLATSGVSLGMQFFTAVNWFMSTSIELFISSWKTFKYDRKQFNRKPDININVDDLF